jgi:hypothetical protein
VDITDILFLTSAMLYLFAGLALILSAKFLVANALNDSNSGIKGKTRSFFYLHPYLFMTIVFLLPILGTLVMWLGYLFVATELSALPSIGIVISGIIALGLWGAFNVISLNSAKSQHILTSGLPDD